MMLAQAEKASAFYSQVQDTQAWFLLWEKWFKLSVGIDGGSTCVLGDFFSSWSGRLASAKGIADNLYCT